MNTLYYGDNLKVLREHFEKESVDLIYLDPPFNSNRSYNVLFKDESGISSDAQITAFDDSWHWGPQAQETYENLIRSAPADVGTMIGALYKFIARGKPGHGNQMMAYLVMMTARLVELNRVLKPTGSLYLHCDPTASHYLKIILDTIFGPENFVNEITWKRTTAHNDPKRYGRIHDVLLFYSKTADFKWNTIFQPYNEEYIETYYRYKDESGRPFLSRDLSAPSHGSENGQFEWKNIKPSPGRMWAFTKENMEKLESENRIFYTKNGFPRLKQYLEDMPGIPAQDIWTDILNIRSWNDEDLGYQTQKPLALLERIIQASSDPGDVILDPFSGCGTCISAAQKLGRQWIGIDITHLAIAMHKNRLKAVNLLPKIDYQIIGEPEDLGGAQQLAAEDRYQFQWWALSLIEARPLGGGAGKTGKKGSDRGIDGVINFLDDYKGELSTALVQVKSGHIKAGDIRDLVGTIDRERSEIGIFITLENPTREMLTEALKAGTYHSYIWNQDYQRIQIFSIEQLLNGAEVKIPQTPSDVGPNKRAEKTKKPHPQQGEFDL